MDQTGASPLPEGAPCPGCGYDVRGLTRKDCPECGYDLDFIRRAQSAIPWCHRQKLGAWSTYWRTVLLVIFRPGVVWREPALPLSLDDARLFGLVTALTVLGSCTGLLLCFGTATATDFPGDAVILLPPFVRCEVVSALMLTLFLWAAVNLRARQVPEQVWPRIKALRYYSLAPLAFAPVLVGCAIVRLIALLTEQNTEAVNVAPLTVPAVLLLIMVRFVRVRLSLRRAARRYWGEYEWKNFLAQVALITLLGFLLGLLGLAALAGC